MARIRSLKPELADDAKLARASLPARYTFVLLISKADDDGLVPGAHRQLLGLLYPHNEEVTVTLLLSWLEELVEIGVARWRMTRDGVPVVELVNWSKHQRIDNKGRNTLRALLVEPPAADSAPPSQAAENGHPPRLAESRGDSPRLAESRRLDRDREREVDREKEGETARRAHAPPPWVEPLRERWRGLVGDIAPSTLQRALAAAVEQRGQQAVASAMERYAETRLAAGKERVFAWFAKDVGLWVDRDGPLVDADGILTERGLAVAGGVP